MFVNSNTGHSPIPESNQSSNNEDSEAESTLPKLVIEYERNRHDDPPEFYEELRKSYLKLHNMVYHGEYDEPTERLAKELIAGFTLSRIRTCKFNHAKDSDYEYNICENDNNNKVMNEINERNSELKTNNNQIPRFSKSKNSKPSSSDNNGTKATETTDEPDNEDCFDNGYKSPVLPLKCTTKHYANLPLSPARMNETNERNSDVKTNNNQIPRFSKSKNSKPSSSDNNGTKVTETTDEPDNEDSFDNGYKSPVLPLKYTTKHYANLPLNPARQNSGSKSTTIIGEQDESPEHVEVIRNVQIDQSPRLYVSQHIDNSPLTPRTSRRTLSPKIIAASFVENDMDNLLDNHQFDNNVRNTSTPKNISPKRTSNGDDDHPQGNKRTKLVSVGVQTSFDQQSHRKAKRFLKTIFKENSNGSQYVTLKAKYKNCQLTFGKNQ